MRKRPNLLEVNFQPGFFPSGKKKGEKLPKAGGFFARKGRTIIIDRQQGFTLAIRPSSSLFQSPSCPLRVWHLRNCLQNRYWDRYKVVKRWKLEV